jgi:multiple sugar transport system substrate-binding protein
MNILTRRSVLRGPSPLARPGHWRPYVANAAATTAEVWWQQGFAKEEDAAFKKMVAQYEKASGNKIDDTIIPFAPLRQKEISAIASGIVPDVMEVYDLEFAPLHSWDDKLVDVSDIVETQKRILSRSPSILLFYNNSAKNAAIMVPMKVSGFPFHIWRSLVEKAGYKISDIPTPGMLSSTSCRCRTNCGRAGCAISMPMAIS